MMSNDLVIAQITDMHIGADNVNYRGINVRKQFLEVLPVLAKKPLDLLILSGDLAAVEGEPEAYAWIKKTLADFPVPYIVMAGNHDHAIRMKEAFDLPNNELSEGMLYFSRIINDRCLLFLDSSSCRVAKQQLDWLIEQRDEDQEPALLFIHHPPIKCGCPFMDEYHALQNIDETWQILKQLPKTKHIFCGHYHTEKTVNRNGKFIHLAPSTAFQIGTKTPEFAIEHTKPGWRIIEWIDKKVHTYVEYL
jgi:Icc protein